MRLLTYMYMCAYAGTSTLPPYSLFETEAPTLALLTGHSKLRIIVSCQVQKLIRYTCNSKKKWVVSSYKESCNNKHMLPNLSPSPNLYRVQSVYNNN